MVCKEKQSLSALGKQCTATTMQNEIKWKNDIKCKIMLGAIKAINYTIWFSIVTCKIHDKIRTTTTACGTKIHEPAFLFCN